MAPQGHLARLSLSALRLATGLGGVEAPVLARWLYDFGRLPRSPRLDRDLGPDDEPMGVLGLSRGSPSRRLLEQRYVASTDSGWYAFFAPETLHTDIRADCKLYVSPRPEALADVFPLLARSFVDADVRSFKVARGRAGLLRPDKIVAYFADRARLEEVARELAHTLTGMPAQGVPFTAELGGGGMLSWGVDPDGGSTGVSWRSWVTQRLATSLAAHAIAHEDPVAATLADISAAGVDPNLWTPRIHSALLGSTR